MSLLYISNIYYNNIIYYKYCNMQNVYYMLIMLYNKYK